MPDKEETPLSPALKAAIAVLNRLEPHDFVELRELLALALPSALANANPILIDRLLWRYFSESEIDPLVLRMLLDEDSPAFDNAHDDLMESARLALEDLRRRFGRLFGELSDIEFNPRDWRLIQVESLNLESLRRMVRMTIHLVNGTVLSLEMPPSSLENMIRLLTERLEALPNDFRYSDES